MNFVLPAARSLVDGGAPWPVMEMDSEVPTETHPVLEEIALPSKDVKNAVTVELYGLDGVLTNRDLAHEMRGEETSYTEVITYLVGACEWLCNRISELDCAEVAEEVRRICLEDILPNRGAPELWSSPGTNGESKIAPALDHVEVVKHAVRQFIQEKAESEGESELGEQLKTMLTSPWYKDMYQYALAGSLEDCQADEKALDLITKRVKEGALVAIVTDSSPARVLAMLDKAGLSDIAVLDKVEKGKIGVIAKAEKWRVDPALVVSPSIKLPAGEVDLSKDYGAPIHVSTDRSRFRRRVRELMLNAGANSVRMITAAPELDAHPMMGWRELNPKIGVLRGPNSLAQGINAAVRRGMLVGSDLEKLVAALD